MRSAFNGWSPNKKSYKKRVYIIFAAWYVQLHCACRKAAPLNLMITIQAIYDCIKTSPDLNSELFQYTEYCLTQMYIWNYWKGLKHCLSVDCCWFGLIIWIMRLWKLIQKLSAFLTIEFTKIEQSHFQTNMSVKELRQN